jgi:hypothetical protein
MTWVPGLLLLVDYSKHKGHADIHVLYKSLQTFYYIKETIGNWTSDSL